MMASFEFKELAIIYKKFPFYFYMIWKLSY